MQIVNSPHVSEPAGHYSHAVIAGGMVYLSGQLPFALDSKILPEGAGAQTRQVLENVRAVLETCGALMDDLVSVQVMISDINLWPEVNQVYSEFFGNHKPARTVIPCGELHYGALVEVTAVAQCRA